MAHNWPAISVLLEIFLFEKWLFILPFQVANLPVFFAWNPDKEPNGDLEFKANRKFDP